MDRFAGVKLMSVGERWRVLPGTPLIPQHLSDNYYAGVSVPWAAGEARILGADHQPIMKINAN